MKNVVRLVILIYIASGFSHFSKNFFNDHKCIQPNINFTKHARLILILEERLMKAKVSLFRAWVSYLSFKHVKN